MARDRKRDRVEVVLICKDGYLAERLGDPAHPDTLGKVRCPGGKIEEGETAHAAAVRELMEEYGLVVDHLEHLWESHGPRGKIVRLAAPADPNWAGAVSANGHEQLVPVPLIPEPWF